MKIKFGLAIDKKVHAAYKKFCKQNGYVMSKRLEQLMLADVKKRLLELPEFKL